MNISYIKDELKAQGSKSSGLDVLLVMDCCCAGIAGRGGKAKGSRVELMAATPRKGIRQVRRTFTQPWCAAFTELLKTGNPFTCDDIIKNINPDSELERYPVTF